MELATQTLRIPFRHVVFYSGFRQTCGQVSGIHKLYLKTWELVRGKNVMLHDVHGWRSDARAMGAIIGASGMLSEAVIIGYSYGSNPAMELVWELAFKRIRTAHLILLDPVRRWPALPGVAATLGRFPIFRKLNPFFIPEEVHAVHLFRQRLDWPTGFPVKIENPEATEYHETELHVGHKRVDDSPVVHAAVLSAVKSFCER
jgi:hypothetical protein